MFLRTLTLSNILCISLEENPVDQDIYLWYRMHIFDALFCFPFREPENINFTESCLSVI